MSDDSDDVKVARNPHTRTQGGRFHTDETCPYIKKGPMRDVPRSRAVDEMGLTECRECSGEAKKSNPGKILAFHVDELDIPPLDDPEKGKS